MRYRKDIQVKACNHAEAFRIKEMKTIYYVWIRYEVHNGELEKIELEELKVAD